MHQAVVRRMPDEVWEGGQHAPLGHQEHVPAQHKARVAFARRQRAGARNWAEQTRVQVLWAHEERSERFIRCPALPSTVGHGRAGAHVRRMEAIKEQ